MDIKEIEFKMQLTEKEMRLRFTARHFESNLPEEVHFCGLIFEIVKQLFVSSRWFNQEYMKVKKKYSVQFKKAPARQVAATKKRTMLVEVEVEDLLI